MMHETRLSACPVPPGQQTNPSAWSHRRWLLALALLGLAIASYLSLYQLGIVPTVWDPLFGVGSERVVSSFVAKSLPIPDALLGVAAYLSDGLLDLIGSEARWRTDPGIVLVFGLVVASLVVTALGLVLVQTLVLHTWCTLCLLSALASFTTGWLARPEVVAAWHDVRQARRRGLAWGPALRGEGAKLTS
jgi:uncharacterized membrane protein